MGGSNSELNFYQKYTVFKPNADKKKIGGPKNKGAPAPPPPPPIPTPLPINLKKFRFLNIFMQKVGFLGKKFDHTNTINFFYVVRAQKQQHKDPMDFFELWVCYTPSQQLLFISAAWWGRPLKTLLHAIAWQWAYVAARGLGDHYRW